MEVVDREVLPTAAQELAIFVAKYEYSISIN